MKAFGNSKSFMKMTRLAGSPCIAERGIERTNGFVSKIIENSARIPGRSLPSELSNSKMPSTVPACRSASTPKRVNVASMTSSPKAGTWMRARVPILVMAASCSGILATAQSFERSEMSSSSAEGSTGCPRRTCEATINPLCGALS